MEYLPLQLQAGSVTDSRSLIGLCAYRHGQPLVNDMHILQLFNRTKVNAAKADLHVVLHYCTIILAGRHA
jgi:hypothetical protein